jgi:hypothetical protein
MLNYAKFERDLGSLYLRLQETRSDTEATPKIEDLVSADVAQLDEKRRVFQDTLKTLANAGLQLKGGELINPPITMDSSRRPYGRGFSDIERQIIQLVAAHVTPDVIPPIVLHEQGHLEFGVDEDQADFTLGFLSEFFGISADPFLRSIQGQPARQGYSSGSDRIKTVHRGQAYAQSLMQQRAGDDQAPRHREDRFETRARSTSLVEAPRVTPNAGSSTAARNWVRVPEPMGRGPEASMAHVPAATISLTATDNRAPEAAAHTDHGRLVRGGSGPIVEVNDGGVVYWLISGDTRPQAETALRTSDERGGEAREALATVSRAESGTARMIQASNNGGRHAEAWPEDSRGRVGASQQELVNWVAALQPHATDFDQSEFVRHLRAVVGSQRITPDDISGAFALDTSEIDRRLTQAASRRSGAVSEQLRQLHGVSFRPTWVSAGPSDGINGDWCNRPNGTSQIAIGFRMFDAGGRQVRGAGGSVVLYREQQRADDGSFREALVAEQATLRLPYHLQGLGIASSMEGSLLSWFRQLGVERVYALAGESGGSWWWFNNGFMWDRKRGEWLTEGFRQDLIDKILKRDGGTRPEAEREADTLIRDHLVDIARREPGVDSELAERKADASLEAYLAACSRKSSGASCEIPPLFEPWDLTDFEWNGEKVGRTYLQDTRLIYPTRLTLDPNDPSGRRAAQRFNLE